MTKQGLYISRPVLFILTFCFLLLAISTKAQNTRIRINEFMALNATGLTDEDGEYTDWIEIHNPTSSAVALHNWSLTDDPDDLQKWQFPEVSIAGNGYLLVYASSKNKKEAGQELHTNFNLSGSGEYLALLDADGQVISALDPAFPAQQSDYSFAWSGNNYVISPTPTPGTANAIDGNEIYPKPAFSHTSGFYENSFQLTLSSPYPEAQIFFTTDGSAPGLNNGTLYSNPVSINTTTVVRAVAVKAGSTTKTTATHTYLFLEDVIRQSNSPEGYPSTWGPYSQISGTARADYGMDPEVTQDSRYASSMKEALLSIPTMSIVTDKDHLFSKSTDPATGGIYIYTGSPAGNNIGKGWERPASIELINPDGSSEFQADVALELHGGHSRLAEKSPKHSFRVSFKSQYGPSRLEYPLFGEDGAQSFNNFNLRAGFGNSIHHHAYAERARWQFIRDIWAKDTQLAMGHPAGRNLYVHLYINGLYWGLYNPTERIDDDFTEAYMGGDGNDYDIMKDYGEVAEGESTAWDAMLAIVSQGLSNNANYQRLLGKNTDGSHNPNYEAYIDPVSLADYMILNFYGTNADWDHHNWVAARNRLNPGTGFKFFSWDAERVLEEIDTNILDENNEDRPSGIFQEMMKNHQFRELFAQRVQTHLFNGGALSPDAAAKRYMARANEIDMAVIAESARWGDYRRDVHNHSLGPFNVVYTKEHWLQTQSYLMNEYFPKRGEKFIAQLKQKGWFPDLEAPNLYINEVAIDPAAPIEPGSELSMEVSAGRIYYTTNGTDPRSGDDGIADEAVLYSAPFSLDQSQHIVARTLSSNGWSPYSELAYYPLEELSHLKVTEIHYHPLDATNVTGGLYEFIELKNTGTMALNLSGLAFNEGISFTFPEGTILEPGQFIVLASSPDHFKERYDLEAFGAYEGALDNAGEELRLVHNTIGELIFIDYDDQAPWPVKADGEGYSLVPTEIDPSGDPTEAANWRISSEAHGSPGRDDPNSIPGPVTSVDLEAKENSMLEQNFPNPFNEYTSIRYSIAKPAFVQLMVYDVYGKKISSLVQEFQPAGDYSIPFHAEKHPSGVYVYQLQAGKSLTSKRMIVIQ